MRSCLALLLFFAACTADNPNFLPSDGFVSSDGLIIVGGDGCTVDLEIADEGVEITATVRTADRTGVEMEALTAVSVAALAIVDMVKALDKGTSIENVRLIAKTGGKSGDWVREGAEQ